MVFEVTFLDHHFSKSLMENKAKNGEDPRAYHILAKEFVNDGNDQILRLCGRPDALDTALLKLLNERADLVHQVGEIKKKDGIEIISLNS